jgi:hypothetical protein
MQRRLYVAKAKKELLDPRQKVGYRKPADPRKKDLKRTIAKWEAVSSKKYGNIDGYESWQYLYLLKSENAYKIGVTKSIDSRIDHMQNGNPHQIRLLFAIKYPNAQRLERMLHLKYANHKLYREWFSLTPLMVRQIVSMKDIQHDW